MPSGNNNFSRSPKSTRRKLLTLLGSVGAAGLAGCGGQDGGGGTTAMPESTPTQTRAEPGLGDSTATPTDAATDSPTQTETETDLPMVSDQTFRLRTEVNPENISLLRFGKGTLNSGTGYDMPYEIYHALREPMFAGRWLNPAYWLNPGQTVYGFMENIEFLDDRTRFTIKEDATWSDGTDITAWDGAAGAAFFRQIGLQGEDRNTFYLPKEFSNPQQAFDDVVMPDGRDGKVWELVDPRGVRDKFSEARFLERYQNFVLAITNPAHVEPVDELAEMGWEQFQEARGMEDGLPSGFLSSKEMIEQTITEEHMEMWRDPDHHVSNGPWQLGEIQGSQAVVLEPNPNYRHADQVNFDGVVFEFSDSTQRSLASLQSDRLDYLNESFSPAQTDGLPDSIEQRTVPGGVGRSVHVDHGDPHLGNRAVRAAIMHALNLDEVAGNLHPEAARPIDQPGGDMWARDAVADDSWVDENLVDYAAGGDTDTADSLMQEAGYTRSNGTWQLDGEPLEYELATDSTDPRFEQTVASQLSNWGIDTQVQTYESAAFAESRDGGEFTMWRGYGLVGFYSTATSFWWSNMNNVNNLPKFNFFPEEDQQEALEGYADNGWVAGNYQTWEDLTIDIPPVGQPDGELQEYAVAYENGLRSRGPESYTAEFYRQYLWITNYWLPVLPMVQRFNQTFLDRSHWTWPEGEYIWPYFPNGLSRGQLMSMNIVSADPENPEEGATVE